MHPVVRAMGKVLRIVGISSPEDSMPKARDGLRSAFVEDMPELPGRRRIRLPPDVRLEG